MPRPSGRPVVPSLAKLNLILDRAPPPSTPPSFLNPQTGSARAADAILIRRGLAPKVPGAGRQPTLCKDVR